MSRTENSLKNMATGVFGQAVTLILQFIYRTVFIQTLGLTYLSVNGLFANIFTVFSFAELGIGQAIVFSLYKPIKNNDVAKTRALLALYRKTYIIIGCVIFLLGVIFIPFLPYLMRGETEGIENLYTIYLIFVFESGISYFFSYHQSYLSACQKQYYLNVANCIFGIFREIVRIALLITVKKYIPVLVVGTLLGVLQNVWFAGRIKKMFPSEFAIKGEKLEKEEKDEIFKNVKALMIYKVGTLALNSTDNIIISAVVGLAWVGLYSNYSILVVSVSSFISILFSSLTASIGNLNAGNDEKHKKRIFDVTNLMTFWFYSIASVCFFVALTPTVTVWLGSEWCLDRITVAVISLNVYVAGMLYTPFNYRQTMGLFVYGKWRPVISAVINIVVSIVLGHFWGLKGVLLGTAIARLTTNSWYDPYIVYKKSFKKSSSEYFVKYFYYFVLLLIGGGVGLFISEIKLLGGIFDILIHCVLCALIMSGIYLVLFFKTEEFKYLKGVLGLYVKKFLKIGMGKK